MTAAECLINLKILTNEMWESAKEAADETCKEVGLVSTKNFCPVLTGALKESFKDEVTENTKQKYTHELSYNTYYAWWVHEKDLPHWNPPNAQWKFLETPVIEYTPKFFENVRNAVERTL